MDISNLTWRKASYSSSNGGNCVEMAEIPASINDATWRKASYSTSNGGNCVEVAQVPAAAVAVRDSKDPDGPVLVFTPEQWRSFAAGIKARKFDLA